MCMIRYVQRDIVCRRAGSIARSREDALDIFREDALDLFREDALDDGLHVQRLLDGGEVVGLALARPRGPRR
jgi:hypothetical protein